MLAGTDSLEICVATHNKVWIVKATCTCSYMYDLHACINNLLSYHSAQIFQFYTHFLIKNYSQNIVR